MIPLDGCAGNPDVGRKAETLARLRAAGLTVPDGVVILPDEPLSAVDTQLAEAVTKLGELGGGAFAVRSSSSIEDRVGASAAGVFESLVGVRGDGVRAAIAHVRASAEAAPARAYLAARGLASERVRMAVLVQPLVRADKLGVARSRAGGFLVEERAGSEPEWGDVEARELPAGADDPLSRGLRVCESVVGGAADVEYARSGDDVRFLQARPSPSAPSAATEPAADPAFAVDGNWRLDAEHNPAPLSAAHAGLVALVDGLGVGVRQRVLGGYLYAAREPARGATPVPLAELPRRFADEIAPACLSALAAAEADGGLPAALAGFTHVYARYVAEVGPSLSRARQQLDQLLRATLGESLAQNGALLAGLGGATLERDQLLWQLGRAIADERAQPVGDATQSPRAALLADYRARFGAYAPAWDVAVPSDDEDEPRVLAMAALLAMGPRSPYERHAEAVTLADAAAYATVDRLDRMSRRAFKALLPLVREVLPIAEDDDRLFFAAQRVVRRALLAVGARLHAAHALDAPSDVFDLPLDRTRAVATDGDANGNFTGLREGAAIGRTQRAAAAQRVPPLAIDDGRPRHSAPDAREVLRGHPTAGHAQGRAVIVRSPADAPTQLPPDAVLVVPAILPSLAYLLPAARALVTDHGGAMSHGATLAREYGLPAVLGTRRATSIADGARVYVDADSGRVYVL